MAFFNTKQVEDQDEEDLQAGPKQTGVVGSAGSPGANPSLNVKPTANSRTTFAGLKDYINANKSQTANLAGQVGGMVTGYGNEARSNIKTGQDQFNKDVDKNTVNVDQRVLDRAVNDPASLVGNVRDTSNLNSNPYQDTFNNAPKRSVVSNRQPINPKIDTGISVPKNRFTGAKQTNDQFIQPLAPPKKVIGNNTVNPAVNQIDSGFNDATQNVNNLSDLKTFTNMRDAEYKGPTSLEESSYYKPIDESVSKANTASEQARTEEGNRALLEDLQKKQTKTINQGALLLNQGLLRGDQGARDILTKAGASNEDLGGLVNTASTAARGRANQGASTTASTRNAVQAALGGQQGKLEQELTNRSQETVEQANNNTQQIISALQSGQRPTEQQLADMGLTSDDWHKLQLDIIMFNNKYGEGSDLSPEDQEIYAEYPSNYAADLSTYLSQQNPELGITPQNVATADDYARYAALNTLLGTDNSFLSDPSLAGTASTDAVDFDADRFREDLTAKEESILNNREAKRERYRQELKKSKKGGGALDIIRRFNPFS